MVTGAWVCLVAPLAGAVVITLLGRAISRRTAATWRRSVFVAFGGAVVAFVDMSSHRGAGGILDRVHLARRRAVRGRPPGPRRPALRLHDADRLRRRWPDRRLFDRLHGGDDEERRYFAYMALFVFAMLLLVQAGNFLILLAGWGSSASPRTS